MEQDIGQASEHHDGANDSRLHLPLRFQRLFLRPSYSRRARKAGESEICFRDLTVVTEVPESGTTRVDARPRRASFIFDAEEAPACLVDLSNLTNRTLEGRLLWSVADEQGQTVAEGTTDVQIAAEERISREVAARLPAPGLYRARFTFEPGGEKGETQPALPPAEAAFLLLRDIAKLHVSADTVVTAKGLTLRLNNQGDGATQFGLSYRVLDQKRQVLRGGSLGQPNVVLKPGEVVECPVSFDGLPTGQYSILTLFDTPDGQRFTSLLSHEVFPRQAALGGRVIDETGQPIPGANVRARLVRRRDPGLSIHDETIRILSTQTGKAGEYKLAVAAMPTDVENHSLYIDVTAKGFVDVQRGYSLRRLLSSRGRPGTISTMRLRRGVGLTGRVVGGDGQPVRDARVHALCVEPRGNHSPWFHWYTPRRTDAKGRFELSVAPGVAIDLIVYSSQWAATRAKTPAGQQGDVDIQLEPGTRASGTLLDEHGQPAQGYWILAESADLDGSRRQTGPIRVAAKTGPDGAFELAPLKGRFTIWAPASFTRWWTEPAEHSPRPRLAVLPVERTFDGILEHVKLDPRASLQVRVAGRVIDVDGKPAKGVGVMIYCNVGRSPRPVALAAARTDEDGRFDLEGIPKGVRDVMITVPIVRSWKRKENTYLKAKPLAHVTGAHDDGSVRLEQIQEDLPNVDFQFRFWSSKNGFLGASAASAPRRKPSVMAGLGRALQNLAERLAQAAPLAGRVLDEAGNGVRGARVRVVLVRRPNDGQEAKEQTIGSWDVETGADGKYALAGVPMPKDAEQCRVRVEAIAEGYARKRQELPLRRLLGPGARALRVPDLHLELKDKQ